MNQTVLRDGFRVNRFMRASIPPKELAQQKAIMKIYHKYQQREHKRIEHPAQFPSDYFFRALAELVLDD